MRAEVPFGADGEDLMTVLSESAARHPASLQEQIRFLLERWGDDLGELATDLTAGADLIAEEKAPRWPPAPGPVEVPRYEGTEEDEIRFSADHAWMPELVLLAKNVYVWLDQLSKRAGRPVEQLDDIPGAELDEIAAAGFSGLSSSTQPPAASPYTRVLDT